MTRIIMSVPQNAKQKQSAICKGSCSSRFRISIAESTSVFIDFKSKFSACFSYIWIHAQNLSALLELHVTIFLATELSSVNLEHAAQFWQGKEPVALFSLMSLFLCVVSWENVLSLAPRRSFKALVKAGYFIV